MGVNSRNTVTIQYEEYGIARASIRGIRYSEWRQFEEYGNEGRQYEKYGIASGVNSRNTV